MRNLIPLALIAAIAAAVASTRKAQARVGNVVAVPVARLVGAAALPPNTIPPNALAAVQVDNVEGQQLRGSVVGWVDATSKVVTRLPIPAGIGPFGFAQSDVVGIENNGRI